MSIGYILYRSFGGAVDGSILKLTSTWNVYFGIYGAIAVVVMLMEIAILATGISMVQRKATSRWHGKLTKVLLVIWLFAFPIRQNILLNVRAVDLANSIHRLHDYQSLNPH